MMWARNNRLEENMCVYACACGFLFFSFWFLLTLRDGTFRSRYNESNVSPSLSLLELENIQR